MQNLARGGLSAEAVEALIRGRHVAPTFGVDMVDIASGRVVDVSDVVEDVTIEYNRDADVRRQLRVTLSDTLDWQAVRLRPWQAFGSARFNLGLFGLETPKSRTARSRIDGQGYDLGSQLGDQVDDTIVAETGGGVLSFVDDVIARAAVPGLDVRLDPTAAAATFPVDLTWALNVAKPDTFQQIADDALAAIVYRPLWVDPDGRARSAPLLPLADRPPEWLFDVKDMRFDIVEPAITVTDEGFQPTNWWGFIYSELGTRPVDGAGMYIVDRSAGGRKVRKWVPLNVTEQAALEAQGADQVAREMAARRTVAFTTGPMPHLDHEDIVEWRSPMLGAVRAVVTNFTMQPKRKTTQMTVEVIDDDDR